ncbi:NHLP bacteriocin export ABC transporter permease/ATPase subunit [Desulfovibrio ferrophilus]|uniref:ATP-binding cassette subfamily B n=1 Tax=Desulfovibrio ferrophilus TaxID=241368 RepID=A0A2Z6AYI1_9BACT|nr:NHLP bacteriocin export ABC transporter permease/ATPase subunit [Desulfovibrio ferrophilus]BBD08225.1 ATP-binding cassette subfamily B [Desulfovibrio ferrophilus]
MAATAPRRRIELDSLDMAWKVTGGDAYIVAEPAAGSGLPRGTETLARIGHDGVVVGVTAGEFCNLVRVNLEATPNARLTPVDPLALARACARDNGHGVARVMELVRQLAISINSEIPAARVSKMLKPGSNFTLPGGFACSALEECWFTFEEGSCRYGGDHEIGKLKPGGVYPLCGNLWIEVQERTRLVVLATARLSEAGRFFPALAGFSQLVMQACCERFSASDIKQFVQLARSVQHRRERFAKTLEQGASIVERDGAVVPTMDLPLSETLRLITSAQGMTLEEPPRLADSREAQLEDILGHNGIFSRTVALQGQWFENDCGPLLGWLDAGNGQSSPVALLPRSSGGYTLTNPEDGLLLPLTEELAQRLDAEGLQLYVPLPTGQLSPLKLMQHSLKGRNRDLITVGVMGILGGLMGFAVPVGTALVVDSVIPSGQLGLLGQIVAGLVMLAIGGAVFELVKGLAMLRVESMAQVSLQSGVFGRLLRLPPGFFNKFSSGDLANRAMAVDGIRQRLSGAVLTTLLSSLFALANIGLLLVYSWQLAVVVTGILLLTGLGAWLGVKSQMRMQLSMQNVIGKLAGFELEMILGINKLRAAGSESNAFARWMLMFSELRKLSYGIGKGMAAMLCFSEILPLFATLCVFSTLMLTGLFAELSLGSFLGFNAAMGQLTMAVGSLASLAFSLMFITPMYQRARPILETPPETHKALESPGELKGRVEVSNVRFRYEGAQSWALCGVSLRAEPGELVAIVGESGSGKSTLLKLLLGFYEPLAGAVLYDGKDLARLDKGRVRRQIGAVIQNGELIQGNVFFNIMGARGGDEDDAWEAARLAAVDEDIRAMPMGMQTFVPHGGGTFSGGQKQRIMIARALAKRPVVVFMDEATSNLDNVSQAKVMENIKRMHATRVVIAHRLSTIQEADRIYVMRGGAVVEEGDYTSLMKAGGLFSCLAARQKI